jgi:hypothetical protein
MTSSLARYAPIIRDPDPEGALKIARRVHAETAGEVVIIERRRLTSWADRKQLEILAEKAGVKRKE